MPTIPTGKMERELRRLYMQWVHQLPKHEHDLHDYVAKFQRQSTELIEKMGGDVARLGALADFPAPKRLDLSLHVGTIYSDMELAAISAQIGTGLNPTDTARALVRAGVDKSYRRLERLARTETVRAYWKNSWDSIEGLGLVMLWGAENGPRTCAWCKERDGLVMDSSNVRDHPNGRCTPLPTHPSQVDYRGSVDAGGRIYQDPAWTRTSKSNVSPPNEAFDPLTTGEVPVIGEAGREAARSYSRSTEELNLKLSQGRMKDFTAAEKDMYDKLLEGMEGKRVSDDMLLYRGVNGLDLLLDVVKSGGTGLHDLVGKTIKNPAFLSTSTDTTTPRNFGDLVYRIKAPKGSNVADISAASNLSFQKEVLIPPGSEFEVLSYEEGMLDGKVTYFLDVILKQRKRK